jgi:hypothetical protein
MGGMIPSFGKPNPEAWMKLEFAEETLLEEKTAKCVKSYMRKKGIEVRKLPLEFSENYVYVKVKDVPKVSEIFKHVDLKKLCGEI